MNALLHLLYSSSFPPHFHLRNQIKLSMGPQSSSKQKKNYDEKNTGFPLEYRVPEATGSMKRFTHFQIPFMIMEPTQVINVALYSLNK